MEKIAANSSKSRDRRLLPQIPHRFPPGTIAVFAFFFASIAAKSSPGRPLILCLA
jgi:hypothetical protein